MYCNLIGICVLFGPCPVLVTESDISAAPALAVAAAAAAAAAAATAATAAVATAAPGQVVAAARMKSEKLEIQDLKK